MNRQIIQKHVKKITTREDAINFMRITAQQHIIDEDIMAEAIWAHNIAASMLSAKGLPSNHGWGERVWMHVEKIIDLVEKQEARFMAEITN